MAEPVFERAENLTAILKGLGMSDFEFDGEFGDRHLLWSPPRAFGGKYLICFALRQDFVVKSSREMV